MAETPVNHGTQQQWQRLRLLDIGLMPWCDFCRREGIHLPAAAVDEHGRAYCVGCCDDLLDRLGAVERGEITA